MRDAAVALVRALMWSGGVCVLSQQDKAKKAKAAQAKAQAKAQVNREAMQVSQSDGSL